MKNQTATTINSSSVVFIDAGVDNYQQLVAGVIPGASVFVLDKNVDGVEQISQVLPQYKSIDAVHIISHGAPGCLYLGNTQLSLDTLKSYAAQLQQWDVANLLLYGCNVAAGDAGEEFIAKLCALTGADIAASKSLTGSAAKGGNWELEVTLGKGVFDAAFSPEVMATYSGVMSPPVPQVMGEVAEIEPNDTLDMAQVIDSSSFTSDYRDDITDFYGKNISHNPHVTIMGTGNFTYDYYKFDAVAGQTFIFDTDDQTFNTAITLYDSSGKQLAFNKIANEWINGLPLEGIVGSFIKYTMPTTDSYVLMVAAYNGFEPYVTIPSWGTYKLHITSVTSNTNAAPTDLKLSNNSIDENVNAKTTVGTFSSTDPDTGNTFTYNLVAGAGDTDNSAFSIANINELRINASPNFEAKSTYNIRVRTTDQGGLSFEKELTVNINDVDEYVYLTPNNDVYRAGADADQIDGLAGSDVLYGNAGNDRIFGGDGNDVVYGGDDNDTISGGLGSDRLYGDAGNDNILGDGGNDILYGGEGDDILNGGAGSDQLYGNNGRDTFVLASGMGQDIIYGFQDNLDVMPLNGDLTFDGLKIVQSGSSTLIKVLATGETIASLMNTNSALIGSADFNFGAVQPE